MHKLLIANRGEIAVRIHRAARDHGLATVAVYSDADAGALHAAMADEAWGLGPGPAAATYLDIDRLIGIARASGADAVHPGYGFLSESAGFAQAVQDAGLVWIGPDPEVIARLGDKVAARALARQVGAPLVPGSDGPVAGPAAALELARRLGLPLAIKAAHGGGGRGIRIARQLEEVPGLFAEAAAEARAAFGRDECYLERFLDAPRHVEAQVLADRHGQVLVLGTRDCSVQRRSQKLVEEAPAPFLPEGTRARIHAAAEAICRAAGYTGAGTVEFLLGADGTLSFLEVNTRLQVEHPVTEEMHGIDILRQQFRIAEGLALPAMPPPRGHAIEFRINAEDPGRGFLPTPGRITRFDVPGGPGVRIDSGVTAGSLVPGLYDSQMAKLIVTGATRQEAIARARRALTEFRIEGVASTLPFHRALLESPAFTATDGLAVHTGWAETAFPDLEPQARIEPGEEALIRGFVEIDGRRHLMALSPGLLNAGLLNAGAPSPAAPLAAGAAPDAAGTIRVETGCLLKHWLVADGQEVAEGDPLAILEAMKTESRLLSPFAGRLRILEPAPADLAAGQPVARIGDG